MFKRLSIVAILLMVAQFLVGMAVNLFVQIPKRHPGAHPAEYFSGAAHSVAWALLGSGLLWLVVHVVLGGLLFLLAVVLLVVAVSRRGRGPAVAAGFGLVGVLAAAFNGASFLNYDEDFSSMLMSVGFAVALAAYSIGLVLQGSADGR